MVASNRYCLFNLLLGLFIHLWIYLCLVSFLISTCYEGLHFRYFSVYVPSTYLLNGMSNYFASEAYYDILQLLLVRVAFYL